MKFPHLKNTNKPFERKIKIHNGVNTSVSPMVMEDNEINSCENMIYKDRLLKSREGFLSAEDKVLSYVTGYEHPKKPFEFLDEKFFIDGKECRIGYTITWDWNSFANLNTYLVFSDGSFKALDPITFNRTDDTTFNIPESISVFKAQKKSGSGIYIFCHLVNYAPYSTEEWCRMFEMTSSYQGWIRIFDDEYYIPTLFYNGRGNLFAESAFVDDPLYKKPSELEAPNLLTGYFYSYFNVDGVSDSFKLPLSDLNGERIVCTLNYGKDLDFKWVITADETEIEFLTTKVTARCDRKAGVISFLREGEPYALPVYKRGITNNLKILAYKMVQEDYISVASSKGAVNYKSNIVLYGNTKTPNRIFSASANNPFYFPKNSFCDIGTNGEAVTAIKTAGDLFAVFTPSSVYSLSLKNGDFVSYTELINGVDKTFLKPDKVSCSLLNSKTGCQNPRTIKVFGDYFIFKGNHSVYAMNKSGKMYSISYPVSYDLNNETADDYDFVSFVYDGFYGINIGGKIYLANIENIKISNGKADVQWYVWDLPFDMKMNSVAVFDAKPIFCFSNTEKTLYYISEISGKKDVALQISDNAIKAFESEIPAFFKTSFVDFDSIKIEALNLSVATKKYVEIEVESYYSSVKFKKDVNSSEKEFADKTLRKITVYPSLKADSASIKVIGEAPLYINEIKFKYR